VALDRYGLHGAEAYRKPGLSPTFGDCAVRMIRAAMGVSRARIKPPIASAYLSPCQTEEAPMFAKIQTIQNLVAETAKFAGVGAAFALSLGMSVGQAQASQIQPNNQRVSFYSADFAYGDVAAASNDIKTLYPAGIASIDRVVHDLQHAGATCILVDGQATAVCVRHDSLIKEELAVPETWTVRVSARTDGVVSNIDLTQSLGGH
jgi:hypothetical protein